MSAMAGKPCSAPRQGADNHVSITAILNPRNGASIWLGADWRIGLLILPRRHALRVLGISHQERAVVTYEMVRRINWLRPLFGLRVETSAFAKPMPRPA